MGFTVVEVNIARLRQRFYQHQADGKAEEEGEIKDEGVTSGECDMKNDESVKPGRPTTYRLGVNCNTHNCEAKLKDSNTG